MPDFPPWVVTAQSSCGIRANPYNRQDIVWVCDLKWDMARNTQFALTVSRFMEKLNLVSLWNHHRVDHTYEQLCRNDRVSQSTIDHFVLSPRLLALVVDYGVVHRGDNLSFTLPSGSSVE